MIACACFCLPKNKHALVEHILCTVRETVYVQTTSHLSTNLSGNSHAKAPSPRSPLAGCLLSKHTRVNKQLFYMLVDTFCANALSKQLWLAGPGPASVHCGCTLRGVAQWACSAPISPPSGTGRRSDLEGGGPSLPIASHVFEMSVAFGRADLTNEPISNINLRPALNFGILPKHFVASVTRRGYICQHRSLTTSEWILCDMISFVEY